MAKGKTTVVKSTITEALDDAQNEVSDLRDEMESWRDNLEDKFSGTEKYERVSEAADTLTDADLEDKFDTLTNLLDSLSDGEPAEPGCPEHIEGMPCLICKWDGVAKKPTGWGRKTITRHDPPVTKTQTWYRGNKSTEETTTYFGQIENQVWCFNHPSSSTTPPTPEQCAEIKAEFERAAEAAEIANKALDMAIIPARKQPKAEVFPIDGMTDLADHQVTYSEFRAYNHTSRANRLGNACTAIRAVIDTLRDALTSDDERVVEVQSAIDDIESTLDDLEAVEFPGMYG